MREQPSLPPATIEPGIAMFQAEPDHEASSGVTTEQPASTPAILGQLAAESGETVTTGYMRLESRRSQFNPPVRPHGKTPEHATSDDVARYHQNFEQAWSRGSEAKVGSREKHVWDRVATYLWQVFDARPLNAIEEDFRFVVDSEFRR